MSTIAAALAAARQHIEASEARLLLRHLLGCSAAHLEAHRDDELDAASAEIFQAWVERRRQGEPVAYLTQTREFYGRAFYVAPGVLIPRPETELVVDLVLGRYSPSPPAPLPPGERGAKPLPPCGGGVGEGGASRLRILDLGTGSGCLAITLALELPQAEVSAVDISREALSIATRNARQLGAAVRLLESDWFSSIAHERFDLIVSNPPYIAVADPHLAQGDLRHEPPAALASGADGLDAIRQIVARAQTQLAPGGWLLFEHGYDQGERVQALLETHRYRHIEQHRDIAGIVRVSGGCFP